MSEDQEGLRTAAEAIRSNLADRLSAVWWVYLLRGLIAAAIGLFALFSPQATVEALVRLIGVLLLLDGASGMIGTIRSKDRGTNLFTALIGVGAGLILLFWPAATARAALILFGAWLGIFGIGLIFVSRKLGGRDTRNTAIMTTGAIMLLLGLVLILWPGVGTVTFSWMFGFTALLMGAVFLFLAIRLRQAAKRLSG
jgi:uncharacterized membrane protein HdeD (DUF308 family)